MSHLLDLLPHGDTLSFLTVAFWFLRLQLGGIHPTRAIRMVNPMVVVVVAAAAAAVVVVVVVVVE